METPLKNMDELAFRTAICAAPESDLPRLVFADWLEERAGTVECGCDDGEQDTGGFTPWGQPVNEPCLYCSGTGWVSNGNAERAEFIRVQCELAAACLPNLNDPDAGCICGRGCDALRRRERELWGSLEPWDFAREWAKKDWTLTTFARGTEFRVGPHEGHPEDIRCVVRRGFVDEVRAPLDVLLPVCRACVDPAMVGHDDPHRDCRVCSGTGRDIARSPLVELVRREPVTRAVATDMPIWPSSGNDTYYVGGVSRLPRQYWSGLDNLPTRAAALDALSAALLELVRGRVGLRVVRC